MVLSSKKKVVELRRGGSFPSWCKGLQKDSQAAHRWGKQVVVCDPGQRLVIDSCIKCSDYWETALVCLALSCAFCYLQNSQIFWVPGKEGSTYKTYQLANHGYGSSHFLVMWEQELACVPWSGGIAPPLEGQYMSITTPWWCLCDLKGASVLENLLSSFSIDCGQRVCQKDSLGVTGNKTDGG